MDDGFRNLMNAKRRVHTNGSEYWVAREIMHDLGYDTWEKFEHAIGRAIEACTSAGYKSKNHFRASAKKVEGDRVGGRRGGDYILSRYACFLVAMNADSRKPEIANAQTYFAWKTRKQELTEDLLAMVGRIEKHHITGIHFKHLNSVAKRCGVRQFGVFQDRRNIGLYAMNTKAVKARKGIPEKDAIVDYAGIRELSAIDFTLTETVTALDRLDVRNEFAANEVTERIGRNVRQAMRLNSEIMPEDLPAEPHIKTITRKLEATKELPPKREFTPLP